MTTFEDALALAESLSRVGKEAGVRVNAADKARQAGIIILNEIGVDPGIDHMSAMRIIDNVHGKG